MPRRQRFPDKCSSSYNLGGELVALTDDGANGNSIWREGEVSAAASGLTLPSDLSDFDYALVDELFYYTQPSAAPNSTDLWVTDGIAGVNVNLGTFADQGAVPGAHNLVSFSGNASFQDQLFFIGEGVLWNGAGTTVSNAASGLLDITNNSNVRGGVVASGSNLFFVARDGVNGDELFVTDGGQGNEIVLTDISSGGSPNADSLVGDFDQYIVDVNGTLFFIAKHTQVDAFDQVIAESFELWKSDGTTAPGGTVFVADLGSVAPPLPMLTALGDNLIFALEDSSGRTGDPVLWVSDGTPELLATGQETGTRPLEVIPPLLSGVLNAWLRLDHGDGIILGEDVTEARAVAPAASIDLSAAQINGNTGRVCSAGPGYHRGDPAVSSRGPKPGDPCAGKHQYRGCPQGSPGRGGGIAHPVARDNGGNPWSAG